jgi:hypothetical protein
MTALSTGLRFGRRWWRTCQSLPVTASLARRVDLYREMSKP